MILLTTSQFLPHTGPAPSDENPSVAAEQVRQRVYSQREQQWRPGSHAHCQVRCLLLVLVQHVAGGRAGYDGIPG